MNEKLQENRTNNWWQRLENWRSSRSLRAFALYFTMVVVSTVAIVCLEHSTIISAVRTAIIAAVGKSVAASWVIGIFE